MSSESNRIIVFSKLKTSVYTQCVLLYSCCCVVLILARVTSEPECVTLPGKGAGVTFCVTRHTQDTRNQPISANTPQTRPSSLRGQRNITGDVGTLNDVSTDFSSSLAPFYESKQNGRYPHMHSITEKIKQRKEEGF